MLSSSSRFMWTWSTWILLSYHANLDVDQIILIWCWIEFGLISLMLNKRRLIHIKICVHLICRNSKVALRIWIQMKQLLPNIKLNLFWWPFNSESWNLCSTKKEGRVDSSPHLHFDLRVNKLVTFLYVVHLLCLPFPTVSSHFFFKILEWINNSDLI